MTDSVKSASTGPSGGGVSASSNPLDIDGQNFDCETYLSKLLKEKNLSQLINVEQDVTKQVHDLDSEMQTLVYENYNKFITATDTIRKMKSDFAKMEDEVEKLTSKMEKIDQFSKQVSEGLNCRRNDMQRLVKASGTLKQLEFMFKLPSTLQSQIQQKDYASAVKAYKRACNFVDKFDNVPAFSTIANECSGIINDLKDQLKDSFCGNLITGKELAANVAYLIQLGEKPENLAQEYLSSVIKRLNSELDSLKKSVPSESTKDSLDKNILENISTSADGTGTIRRNSAVITASVDILEFIDSDCSNFLSNLGLMIASCNELFPQINLNISESVDNLLKNLLICVENRFITENQPNQNMINFGGGGSAGSLTNYLSGSANLSGIGTADSVLITRALDRFYRRIQATSRMLPATSNARSYEKLAYQIVLNVCLKQVQTAAELAKRRFDFSLTEIRQRLAIIKNVTRLPQQQQLSVHHPSSPLSAKPDELSAEPGVQSLADLLSKLERSVVHDLKSALAGLLQMTTSDLSFVNQNSKFVYKFGFMTRNELIVAFFDHVIDSCRRLSTGSTDFSKSLGFSDVGTTLILLLAKFCYNLSKSTVGYLLDLCEQQFRISQFVQQQQQSTTTNQVLSSSDRSHDQTKQSSSSSNQSKLFGQSGKSLEMKFKNEAQFLIDQFVVREGFAISQMLVKSVETRDWLGCVEPKSVRAVMKRVVEDLTSIDWRLSQFLEEGKRADKSSDSSRRTSGFYGHALKPALGSRPQQHNWPGSSGTPSTPNTFADSALSNTLGKLWTERIDFFTSAEFTKVSVMTGIIKICLKTLLESVRLKTYGKFGLQQIQVDARYLQTFLWRFVSDENVINTLLDEILSSALHRCTEMQLMEPSVIEVICERG